MWLAAIAVLVGFGVAGCAASAEVRRTQDDYAMAARCLEDAEGPADEAAEKARLETCREVCDKGVAAGCWTLGRALLVGEGRDPKAALTEFDAGCTLGDAASCVEAGVLAERGVDGPGDATRAMRYYPVGWFLSHATRSGPRSSISGRAAAGTRRAAPTSPSSCTTG